MKLKRTNEKVNLQIFLQNEIRNPTHFTYFLLKMPMNISVGNKKKRAKYVAEKNGVVKGMVENEKHGGCKRNEIKQINFFFSFYFTFPLE